MPTIETEVIEVLPSMSLFPDYDSETSTKPPWIPERRTTREKVDAFEREGLGQIGRLLNIKMRPGLTIYNPSSRLTFEGVEYLAVGGKEFMAVRGDISDQLVSSVVGIVVRGERGWELVEDVPIIENAEDPHLVPIDGKPMLNIIKVTNPEEVRKWGKRVRFHHEFYTTDDLRSWELLAIGPQNHKDVRMRQDIERKGHRDEIKGFNRRQRQELDPPPEIDELIYYLRFLQKPLDPKMEKNLGQWPESRVRNIRQLQEEIGSGFDTYSPIESLKLIISKLNYLTVLDDGTSIGREKVPNVLKLVGDAQRSTDLAQFIEEHEKIVLYEDGGMGKIGYFEFPNIEYLKDSKNIADGSRTLEGLFGPGSYGGVGDFHIKGDRLEVLDHEAYRDKDIQGKDKLHYYAGEFVYVPKMHLHTPNEIILRRSNFPPAPSKPADPDNPDFLDDVIFPGDRQEVEGGKKSDVLVGAGDARIGEAVIENHLPLHHKMLDEWIQGSTHRTFDLAA